MLAFLIGAESARLGRIGRILSENGWSVERAPAPPTAPRQRLSDHAPHDLAVIDGAAADERVRAWIDAARTLLRPRLLLLAGGTRPGDRVRALRLGADAPIDDAPATLILARVLALLRLDQNDARTEWRVGDLCVDPLTRRVRRSGRDIALSPREYQFLLYLMRRPGAIAPRSTIIEALWPDDLAVGDNAVDAMASRLRRKLDGAGSGRLLHTVRGVGYRLLAPEEPGRAAA
jgi:DNA-binding response OmpR family regulator